MVQIGKEITVGGIRLQSNILMAPLAGYTCFPFRLMVERLGAGTAYTEMVSSDGLKYDDRATAKLLYTDEREKLKCVQLLGSVPMVFEHSRMPTSYYSRMDLNNLLPSWYNRGR